MPFPGGDADKVGNRYEALWTVYCLLQILRGDAKTIHIEQIGTEWDGVEFVLQKSVIAEFHQVKRQNSNKGHWPLATLASKKILSNAHHLLGGCSSSEYIFVSSDNVAQLHELTERARALKNFDLFQREGLKSSDHQPAFDKVVEYLGVTSKAECYRFLQSFRVEVIGEPALRRLVKASAAGLISGNTDVAIALLRSYAENNLQTDIGCHDLWRYLSSRHLSPVRWSQDENVIVSIQECNERYANTQGRYLINNREISRVNLNEKIDPAIHNDKKVVTVVGEAGSGKSVVMQQAFNRAVESGHVVLGFRIDRLPPKQSSKEIGQYLGLPESPVHVLAHIAGDLPCILFIDQLDAVSLTSGRNPEFFNCISEIFMQVDQYPNMKLVVGCRKFDLDNDHRFRSFLTKEKSTTVTVTSLSVDEVDHELRLAGISSEKLNKKQKLLLQQPLLLGIFIQVAADGDALNFSHEGDLFRLKVRHVKDELRERLSTSRVQWTLVVGKLSGYMSQHQMLSVPERLVETHEEDARILASSGVLLYENRRYSFFHESFFDYVFATAFLDSGDSICDLLLSAEQHLFRRAQVRQILSLQRSEDFDTYLLNIKELLQHDLIRLHIKVCVLEWMGELDIPTLQELKILLVLAEDEKYLQFRQIIWNCMSGRSAWFALLDQENVINQWLTNENEQWIDHGVWYLRTVQRVQADRVADILLPLYEQDKNAWQQRLLFVMQWADFSAGRKFFDFFLLLLADGVLDEAKGPIAVNSDFFDLARALPDSRPEWIGELFEAYIRRQLILKPINSEQLYSLEKGRDSSAKRLIKAAAKITPEAFTKSLLPLILELAQATRMRNDSPDCIIDSFWGMYLNGSFSYHMHTYIIKGTQSAIDNLAKHHPVKFRKFFDTWRDSPYFTMQYLIISGLTHAGDLFADEAIEYLIECDCRLDMGSGHGWLSRQLIEAVTLCCSDEKLLRLENRLLNFYGNPVGLVSWEGKKVVYSHFGYDQFTLLTGINKSRRSQKIKGRIKEWQRKFHVDEPRQPRSNELRVVSAVRSPISLNKAQHMADEQWLKAIAHYDTSDHNHSDMLKGGAHQLAGSLREQTAQEPQRFAMLCTCFPINTHHAYFEAIVMGLSPANNGQTKHIDLMLLTRCIRYIFSVPDKPCGRSLPRLISSYKHAELSNEILDILLWFARHASDPDSESSGVSTNQGYINDLATKAINSVRGSAVGSIAELIFENEHYYKFFKSHLSLLCQSEANLAVRSEMAYFILAASQYDKNHAFELLELLLQGQPDEFLTARWVDEYIHYAIFDDLERILPIVQRMLGSKKCDFVQQAGSRHACVAGLVSENHDGLIHQCLQGNISHRRGAAEVFSTNVISELHSRQCMELLSVLFEDDSEEVRNEAAFCFSKFKDQNLLPYQVFISSFITSRAIEGNSSKISYLLENSLDQLPDTVLELVQGFLDCEGKASADIRTAAAGDSYHLNELLIRLYAQTNSNDIKTGCLDVIDQMVSIGSSGLDDKLQQFDR